MFTSNNIIVLTLVMATLLQLVTHYGNNNNNNNNNFVAATRQEYLFGEIGIDHEWNSGDLVEWIIDVPSSDGSKWIAVGRADSSMGPGQVVACVADYSTCSAYQTTAGFSITTRTDSNIQFVSKTTQNDRIYVRVRATASLMNLVADKTQRIIFAKGDFNLMTQQPQQHTPQNRGSDSQFLVSGPTTTTTAVSSSSSAPSSTTLATTTTTPIPTTIPTTTTSSRKEYLNGGIGIEHDWSSGDTLEWIIDVPSTDGSKWIAVGRADSSMGPGNVVACVADYNTCSAYATTAGFSITTRTDSNVQFVSKTTLNDRIYVRVRATASLMDLVANTNQRIIFAKGSFNLMTQQPQQHSSQDRGWDNQYLVTGPTTTATPPTTATPTPPPTTVAATSTSSTSTVTSPPQTTVSQTTASGSGSSSHRQEFLNGGIGIDHEWTAQEPNFIYWTIDVPSADSSKWIAVGRADSSMGPGKVVACIPQYSYCLGYTTTAGYQVQQRQDDAEIAFISQTAVGDRIYVKVKATASKMDTVANQNQRLIFAKGTFNLMTQTPNQHSSTDRGSASVFIIGPAAPSPEPSTTAMTTTTIFVEPSTTEAGSQFSSSNSNSNSNSGSQQHSNSGSMSNNNNSMSFSGSGSNMSFSGSGSNMSFSGSGSNSTSNSDGGVSSEIPSSTTTSEIITQPTTGTEPGGSSSSSSSAPSETPTQQSTSLSSSSPQTSGSSSSSSLPITTQIGGSTTDISVTSIEAPSSTSLPSVVPSGTSSLPQSSSSLPPITSSQLQPSSTTHGNNQQTTTAEIQTSSSSPTTPQQTQQTQQTQPTTTFGTPRPVPTTITRPPPSTSTTEPALTPSPPAPTAPPQLEFVVKLQPKSGQTQVDVNNFQQDLANLLGTAVSNIILIPGETENANGTMTTTVTVKFLSADSRTQLQDEMKNMTTTEKDQLGIVSMNAAPSATTAEPPVDEDWTLIFVALAFMGFIAIVGFFVYRKLSREMKEKKKNSKQSMEDFKESLMSQYAMDYENEGGENVGAGAATMSPASASEMVMLSGAGGASTALLATSPSISTSNTKTRNNKKNNNNNKPQTSMKPPQKEYYYDDEGNAFYYDENGDAWYCEEGEGPEYEDGAGISATEQEEL